MPLSSVQKISISEQIVDQMKQQILNREWLPGEKLPSEAELCSIFDVSRVTIRQALQKLVLMGLVETRLGSGSFVRDVNDGVGPQVKTVLLPSAYLQEHSLEEVMEFRAVLETETARLAARRATAEDVAHLKNLLGRQLDETTRTAKSFSDDDMEFHMTIARCTGNSLVIAVYEIMWDILNSTLYQNVRNVGYQGVLPYHRQLIDALANGDEESAARTMAKHIENNRVLASQHTKDPD